MEFKPGTAGSHDTTTAHFATQVTEAKNGEPIDVNQPLDANDRWLFRMIAGE